MLDEFEKTMWNHRVRGRKAVCPPEKIREFWEALTEDERAYFQVGRPAADYLDLNLDWVALRWHWTMRSYAEARRLGLEPDPRYLPLVQAAEPTGDCLCVIGDADVDGEQEIALAQRGGFEVQDGAALRPGTMWQTVLSRRDGDALVGLMGDDRYRPNGKLWLVVVWAPASEAAQGINRSGVFDPTINYELG
ncbi:MAG TPA: hypothetical protein VFS21_16015 [Roseiflexaceae bacterium]|nr:hypothetical protein [Roseiflexaceae bacterium]